MPDERSLLFLQPRNMRVTEKRNAVRAEPDNLIHRVRETRCCLIRKPIDQIYVDAVEAQFARGQDQIAGHFEGLNPVHRLLYFRVEILNSHTQAIEAQPAKRFQVFARGDPRINLDSNFAVWSEMKMLAREFEQIL